MFRTLEPVLHNRSCLLVISPWLNKLQTNKANKSMAQKCYSNKLVILMWHYCARTHHKEAWWYITSNETYANSIYQQKLQFLKAWGTLSPEMQLPPHHPRWIKPSSNCFSTGYIRTSWAAFKKLQLSELLSALQTQTQQTNRKLDGFGLQQATQLQGGGDDVTKVPKMAPDSY